MDIFQSIKLCEKLKASSLCEFALLLGNFNRREVFHYAVKYSSVAGLTFGSGTSLTLRSYNEYSNDISLSRSSIEYKIQTNFVTRFQ